MTSIPTSRPRYEAGLCAAIFLVSLLASGLGLRALLPERTDIPVISQKLALLRQSPEQIDTLFIGTSRVFHELDPHLFDATSAALGQPTHSFNLAADGMNFPETFYALTQACRLLPGLRRVFLELGSMQQLCEENTLREVYWHDLRHSWLSARSLWCDPTPATAPKRLIGLATHARLFLQNAFSIGAGTNLIAARLQPSSREATPRDFDAAGFLPIAHGLSPREAETFAAKLSTKHPALDLPVRPDATLATALRDCTTQLRARGIEPCFLLLPAFRNDRPPTPTVPDGAPAVQVANFDDPAKYPELFVAANYYDPNHLNTTGATALTRLVATAAFAPSVPAQVGH